MRKQPVCVVHGDEGSLIIRPSLPTGGSRGFDVRIDVFADNGTPVLKGIRLSEIHRLEDFITAVYDWRREIMFGGTKCSSPNGSSSSCRS